MYGVTFNRTRSGGKIAGGHSQFVVGAGCRFLPLKVDLAFDHVVQGGLATDKETANNRVLVLTLHLPSNISKLQLIRKKYNFVK